MNADADPPRHRGAARPSADSRSPAPACPGTVFVGPLDDAGRERRGADSVPLSHRARTRACAIASTGSRRAACRPVQVFQNSLPLDLYFLVTVGTTPGSSEETLLRALGFAMQALQIDPDLIGAGRRATKRCTSRSSR